MKTTQTKIATALLGLIIGFSSCDSGKDQPQAKKPLSDNIEKKPRIGDVRDSHGCLISGGYTWSAAKDSCIRLWESGAELEPTDRSEMIVYAVVSNDKMRAEIFIPNDTSYVLTGNGDDSYSKDSLTLTVSNDKYALMSNGKVIYQTAVPVAEEKPVRRRRRR